MPIPTGASPRLVAAAIAEAVFDQGQAADVAMDGRFGVMAEAKDRALTRRLVHGLMRDWPRAESVLNQLLQKPFKPKDRVVFFILAVALSELLEGKEPEHAIVHSAVEASRLAPAPHLAKLVNAILRRFLRERSNFERAWAAHPAMVFGYPAWLIHAIQQDWPDRWAEVLAQGNASPPLTLRVNRRHWSREKAMEALSAVGMDASAMAVVSDGVMLAHRQAIRDIPQFMEGGWSVQDASAQWAVDWLQLESGQRVLDACAGPGGKAAHCLERADIDLLAIDNDAKRLDEVAQGFDRLGLKARCLVADASDPDAWWDGVGFDRILIDAPCSATGVIRRHPDIRWLRQPGDLDSLIRTQQAILTSLWPLLKPGGILVYVTCSVLAGENHHQIQRFLETHDDATVLPPIAGSASAPGQAMPVGWQVLPGEHHWDGFYFARLGRMQSD